MKVVYQQFPEFNYTLINRCSSFQPWILAWGYDWKSQTWCQGHYFQTLDEVEDYLNKHAEEYGSDNSYKVNYFEAFYDGDESEPFVEYYYPLIDTFN